MAYYIRGRRFLRVPGFDYSEADEKTVRCLVGDLGTEGNGAWEVRGEARYHSGGLEVNSRIKRFLASEGIEYFEMVHAPAKTSIESAGIRGSSLSQGIKCLVFDAGRPVAVLVQADKRADTKALKNHFRRNVRMVSPEEAESATGCEVGGIPPFFHGLDIHYFAGILDNEISWFNSGLRNVSMAMKTRDVEKALKYLGAEEIM